ncbi:hypothetical protein F2Q70_00043359 [Brassica cretica]|nr:hypothetical protein F2Q70_00043359 [Brassica cretica]
MGEGEYLLRPCMAVFMFWDWPLVALNPRRIAAFYEWIFSVGVENGSPERSVRKEIGQDPRTGPFSLVCIAHGQGQPSPRSPSPWARMTSTTVTSPMGEDDHHQGHLANGRGRPAPRSARPWARTTSTTVTSPMGEDDHHQGHLALGENDQQHGHLAHGQRRSAPGSPRPRARIIQSRSA